MAISVREAVDRKSKLEFVRFPWKIYDGDPLWVPPILADRKNTVIRGENAMLKRGSGTFFMAYDGRRPVGTICAAIDPPTNKNRNRHDCVIGFFDCVDDTHVAEALFNAAAKWGKARDLENLFGPFNLDYENGYGVLIQGRDRPPAIMCGHTPPYYRKLFEDNGFEKARGDNLAFSIPVDPQSPEQRRLSRLGEIVRKRSNFTIRSADFARIDEEIDRIHYLLLNSLAHLEGSVPWQRDSLERTIRPLMKLSDPEFVLFAEVEGRSVGWFPGIKNLNEHLIKLNGVKWPFGYIKLFRALRKKTECLAAKSLLVLPEYWNTGVSILLFDEMAKRAHKAGFSWVDLSLTAEDNPQTPIIAGRMGAIEYKRYRTYIRSIT